MKVTRADWPLPLELQAMESPRRLEYSRRLSPRETELMVQGMVPYEMEDHWFIYEANDVVHLYRSWTGVEMFAIRLHRSADGGAEIAEVEVDLACKGTTAPLEGFDEDVRGILDIFFNSLSGARSSDLATHVFGRNPN